MWTTVSLVDEDDAAAGGMLAERHSFAAARVHGSVWVYGGLHGGALSDHLLELRPESWTWRRRHASGQRPPATMLHTMAAHGDSLLLFGGLVQGPKTSVATNQLWLLQTMHCSWASPSTSGEPRGPVGCSSSAATISTAVCALIPGIRAYGCERVEKQQSTQP